MPYFSAACLAIGTPYKASAKDKRNVTAAETLLCLHDFPIRFRHDPHRLRIPAHAAERRWTFEMQRARVPGPAFHLPGSLWIAQQDPIASASAAAFPASTSSPVSPGTTNSGMPPTAVATTGFSAAMAENGDAEPFIQRRQDEKIQQREDPGMSLLAPANTAVGKTQLAAQRPSDSRAGPSPTMRSWQRGSLPRGFNVAIARNST